MNTLEHPLKILIVEEHLKKDIQKFPRLEAGIKQGAWEVRTLILWEVFAPDSLQD